MKIQPINSMQATWYATAASIWSFAFAALTFYWALGGTAGIETIGPAITGLAGDPVFLIFLWLTGIFKLLAGLLALALFQPWAAIFPQRLRLAAAWALGLGLLLYGLASFIQHLLMLTSVVPLPAGLGAYAARWHLALWDPWWMLGGLLFLLAAHSTGRMRRF